MKPDHTYQTRLGNHALVFGGSGEIGFAIMCTLAARGVENISFTYNARRHAAEAAATALRDHGVSCHFDQLDHCDEPGIMKFLEQAVRANAGEEISMVVYAAGYSPNMNFQDWNRAEMEKVFVANTYGAFFSLRVAADRMTKKGVRGSLVVITSTNAFNSFSPYSVGYDMSKGALGPLVSDLALEYAPYRIRVNGAALGWIDTRMNDSLPFGEHEKESAKIWLGGSFLSVEQAARPIVNLLSSDSDGITGQNIMIDGGYR